MASSRAALWAAAVDGGFSKGEAFVSQMPDGKNPENPGFSWALPLQRCNPDSKFACPGFTKCSPAPVSAAIISTGSVETFERERVIKWIG